MSSAFLDPGPFRKWYREQKKTTTSKGLARQIGIDPRTLRRWDDPTQRIRRSDLEAALEGTDFLLGDIYPELVGREAEIAFCPSCQEEVAIEGRECLWCGCHLDQKAGTMGKLKDRHFRALHKLHTDGGLTIRELGRRVYKRAGYSSAKSAEVTIWRAFHRLELPIVDRRVNPLPPESRQCTGTTPAGERCPRWTMLGESVCWSHHEEGLSFIAARPRDEAKRCWLPTGATA
jgi:hypothetical protein